MSKLAVKRNELGYSQTYMAEKLGITVSSYCMYEKGQRNIPLKFVGKIMKILQIENIEEYFAPTTFTVCKSRKKA